MGGSRQSAASQPASRRPASRRPASRHPAARRPPPVASRRGACRMARVWGFLLARKRLQDSPDADRAAGAGRASCPWRRAAPLRRRGDARVKRVGHGRFFPAVTDLPWVYEHHRTERRGAAHPARSPPLVPASLRPQRSRPTPSRQRPDAQTPRPSHRHRNRLTPSPTPHRLSQSRWQPGQGDALRRAPPPPNLSLLSRAGGQSRRRAQPSPLRPPTAPPCPPTVAEGGVLSCAGGQPSKTGSAVTPPPADRIAASPHVAEGGVLSRAGGQPSKTGSAVTPPPADRIAASPHVAEWAFSAGWPDCRARRAQPSPLHPPRRPGHRHRLTPGPNAPPALSGAPASVREEAGRRAQPLGSTQHERALWQAKVTSAPSAVEGEPSQPRAESQARRAFPCPVTCRPGRFVSCGGGR